MVKGTNQIGLQQKDPIKELRALAKKLKVRKIDVNSIEEEYEERWKISQNTK